QRLGITTVVVTHDQDEALSISDRVAVMNGGRIEQYAAPVDLYRTPATTFVGGFVGAMNTLSGLVTVTNDGARVTVGGTSVAIGSTNLDGVKGSGESRTGDAVNVRPEDVVVAPDGEGARARVDRVIPRGHFTEVVLDLEGTTVRAYVDADTAIVAAPDRSVSIHFRRALVYRDGTLL
ncbi:MAG: TOBE domain-containing protein, partial [Lapillicoccus sp.]